MARGFIGQPNNFQSEVDFTAFSGAHMHVTVGPRRVGTLSGIQVSITRDVAAVYGMGDANPLTFVRGKRGIAGSMIFSVFDRHALLRDVFREAYNSKFNDAAVNGMITTQFANLAGDTNVLGGARVPTRDFNHNLGEAAISAFGPDTDSLLIQEFNDVYDMVRNQRLRYSDQIPEFDVTITMVNESGRASVVVIGGIVLVNEGFQFTLDDMVSDTAFSFVAKYITPLTALTDTVRERAAMNQPYMGIG